MNVEMFSDVILTADLPEHRLRAGDVGTVAERHDVPGKEVRYSVEFFDMTGRTVAVVTVPAGALRAPTTADRPTARRLDATLCMTHSRFSLRSLLLGMALLGALFAVVRYALLPPPAIRKVEALGGVVSGARVLGSFRRWEVPTELRVKSDGLTDDDLRALARFRSLSHIEVASRGITDAGILAFETLAWVGHVEIEAPNVTDDGMSIAGRLNVDFVRIVSDRVTGSFLRSYPARPLLRILEIHSPLFGDDSVQLLTEMPRLDFVDVSGCDVSDIGLGMLVDARALLTVNVSNTNVTPEGFARFVRHVQTSALSQAV